MGSSDGSSGVFSQIMDVAGRGAGLISGIAALRGGGLLNYMMQRERLLNDPNFRAGLTDSPFTAGFFGLGGGTQPGAPQWTTQPIAQPSEFMGPTVSTPAGPADIVQRPGPSHWQPNLPPLSSEEALKEQARQTELQGISGGDIAQVAKMKTAAGIPLTGLEEEQLVQRGKYLQGLGGVGSVVKLDIPGTPMTIGSPYNIPALGEEEFPTPEQAREASNAHGWGGRIGPTVHGGWRPIPPPTREQTLPPPPGTPGGQGGGELPQYPGPVFRGGGGVQPSAPRAKINPLNPVFDQTAAKYGLPRGLLNAVAQTESNFDPGIKNPTSGAQGLMQFLPSTAQVWNVDPYNPTSAIDGAGRYLQYLIKSSGGDLPTALQRYGGARTTDYAGPVLARMQKFQARMQQPQQTPAPALPPPPPPPAPTRPVLNLGGTAYAAEAPSGAQVQQPPPAPAFDREAIVPHVVVPSEDQGAIGYAPAAPAQPPGMGPLISVPSPPVGAPSIAPPPPGQMQGIPTEARTGMPLKSHTQEYGGGVSETYTAPELGGAETQLMFRHLGITNPMLANDDAIIKYFNWKQALDDEAQMHKADIERIYKPTSEQETRAVERLNGIKNTIETIATKYSPAERAHFIGWWQYPRSVIEATLSPEVGKRFADFRADIASLAPKTFDADAKASTLTGNDLGYLQPWALNPYDRADQFESNLQKLSDGVKYDIAFRSFVRGLRPEQVSDPAVLEGFNKSFNAALAQQRLDIAHGQQPAAPPSAAPAAPAPQPKSAWAPTTTWTVP
ncbi:MAG TPA: lytic transglycosylase domain-containing protein [Steroidobacteraceae bacterium]|nr:lytic transglycosylase domain-containing protein [Steroidobacteraceae bacterium]